MELISVSGRARMKDNPTPRPQLTRLACEGSIAQSSRVYQPTSLEALVEAVLRKLGVKYAAQFSTRSGFVLDFAVWHNGRKIALEADGPLHDKPQARKRDAFRSLQLKREGWEVVRIHHTQVTQIESILKEVLNDCG